MTQEQTPCGKSRYRVALADGRLSFEAEPGDTVLSSLLRAGIGTPYECNAGSCGSCKFVLLDGEISEDLEQPPGLRNSDRRKNKRLACISRIRGDCRIDLRLDPAYAPRILPRRVTAAFLSRTRLTHDLCEFRFRADEPARFLPGQYAKVQLQGVAGPRSYSMCNTANDEGIWAFQIKRVAGGAATTALFDRDLEGCSVSIDAPYSIAHLEASSSDAIIGIAGGSGLAPLVSILRGLSELKGHADRPLLYYGARTPADVVAAEYFASIRGFDAARQYVPVVTEPDAGWPGPSGFMHEHLAKVLPADCSGIDFFLAGPPPMVDAVRRLLVLDLGVSVERLHYDRFF